MTLSFHEGTHINSNERMCFRHSCTSASTSNETNSLLYKNGNIVTFLIQILYRVSYLFLYYDLII